MVKLKLFLCIMLPREPRGTHLERLVSDGCNMIFSTSYNYGVTTKELAQKYPEVQFCMATCSNANEEPYLKNYHTFMGAIYQGRYAAGVLSQE